MEAAAANTVEEAVAEIMRIHRSLPPRLGIEEVEAAETLIRNMDKEDQLRLEAIAKQPKGSEISEELFFVLQEMQRGLAMYQSKEQRREAMKLLDLENLHSFFDDLVQRASLCVSSSGSSHSDKSSSVSGSASGSGSSGFLNSTSFYAEKEPLRSSRMLFSKDDTFVSKAKVSSFHVNGINRPQILDSSLNSGELNSVEYSNDS